MKLIKLSSKKEFAFIGSDDKSAKWYVIEPTVKKFIEAIPFGSEVSIKSDKREDKKDHLTFIKVESSAPTVEPVSSPEPVSEPLQEVIKTAQTVLNTSDSSSVANMVAGTMIALQGQITLANAKEVMTSLYQHGKTLVG